MENTGALTGLTVLDLSRLLPGPYASMILADHGARVICIEDRRFSAEFLKNNTVYRNKEHMTLNLKSDQGRAIFFKLARSADVVLEGFRPGVTSRLGVDYKSVSELNPKIVYCSITGYGQTGPYRDVAGHDVNYLSRAGVLDLIGEAGRPPSIPGVQIADMASGGMNAVAGILMALLNREKTGRGQYIDISMTDGSMSLLSMAFNFFQLTGSPVQRADSFLSHRYACYNTYETADGRYLSIGAVESRFWKILCAHLGVPEYTDLQYDDMRREEIKGFLKKVFLQKSLAQWEEELGNMDICWAPVRNLSEIIKDPLFKDRDMICEFTDDSGSKFFVPGVPVNLSDTPGSVRKPPPGFGENTRSILAELEYNDTQIEQLGKDGII
ncbi:MAG: CoA transferase [Deltaproteobacteria bacterium]|nr:CoA transferase [Deltaproteobacteria bacterium]